MRAAAGGRPAWAAPLMAAAIVCAAGTASASGEAPLLGASLTWAVHRNFRADQRDLTFTLRTAWKYGIAYGSDTANPQHALGDVVSVKEPFEDTTGPGKGQRFGALCYFECLDEPCSVKRGTDPVCHDNDFIVQTHDTAKKYTAGIFTKTVSVDNSVVGILAYLSFKTTSSLSLSSRYKHGAPGSLTFSWSSLMPKASGATVKTNSFELCNSQTDVRKKFCATDVDCARIQGNQKCGADLNRLGQYGGNEYFGQEFLARFASGGVDLFAIAPTFVQLCCKQCQADSESAGCDKQKTRLKNYYSPVPSFPLALFQGEAPSTYDVRLKISDYDGHMLRLLPTRVQNPKLEIARVLDPDLYSMNDSPPKRLSGELDRNFPLRYEEEFSGGVFTGLDQGRFKFHDYMPDEGPIVRLQGPSRPEAIFSEDHAEPTRQVFEVQDYMWDVDGIEDAQPSSIGAADTSAVTMGVDPDDNKPTATDGGSSVQVVFSTMFQTTPQCKAARIPRWKAGIPTEITCPHDEQSCFVELESTTGEAASELDVMEAPGFEQLKVRGTNYLGKDHETCKDFSGLPMPKPAGIISWDLSPALCKEYGQYAPCGCCENRAKCPDGAACPSSILSKKQCRYNAYGYNIDSVGEQRVMCYVAKAKYCVSSGFESEENCPGQGEVWCYSQPLCVRFNIVGSRPKFVDPTPLAPNSRDALGRIVEGRTDVAACLGHPLQLTIKAVDQDSGDEIRIFVDDELRPTSFFSDAQNMFDSSCGKFNPFAGQRVGGNDAQKSILHLLNAEFDSTITSDLNPELNFSVGEATQRVLYTLDLDRENGIVTLKNDADAASGYCGSLQTCRQRLLNMNRIICGYAYDNSRSRYARWVGKRPDPAMASKEKDYADDHSLGSYATDRHCWRITLQAPPIFVTNGTGCVSVNSRTVSSVCTPFGHSPGLVKDTTGDRMSYANISLSVLQTLDVKFVAFDPNPEDRIQLFVMEDPGVPPNMVIGRSTCEPRSSDTSVDPQATESCPDYSRCPGGEAQCECTFTKRCNPGADEASGEGSKCRFCDALGATQCNTKALKNCPGMCTDSTKSKNCECTGFCPSDLSCNRASLRLTWQPDSSDFGKSFFVCVVARDNSNLCQGQGIDGTTERGWYGEQQCVYLNVVPPAFRFEGPWIEDFVKGTSKAEPYGIYVGCTFKIELTVQEVSDGANYGGMFVRSNALSQAPADAMETASNWKGEKKMEIVLTQASVCTDTSVSICTAEVEVTPRLGSEGFYFQLCFSAGDQLGMVLNKGICTQDPFLKPCNLDSDCPQGTCLPLCFDLRVEKCRYCIKDGPEILRAVTDKYMIDTNWMRIWTLNGDSFGNLKTDCPQYFDCDKGISQVVAIDNPELIIKSQTGSGKRILWTGVLYSPVEAENAAEIACRFRTGLKSLQHNNPDMAIGNGSLIFQPGDSVCLSACNAGTLLQQQEIPECMGIE